MKDYSSRLLFEKEYLTDIRPLLPEFRRRLTEVLAEIIDPKKPFPATACGKQICDYCDFCRLCTDRKTE